MSDIPTWSICSRCGVRFTSESVYFSHRPDLPATHTDLARKVCQWALKADVRNNILGDSAQRPVNCANPHFNPSVDYGAFDPEGIPSIPLPHPSEM